MIISNEQHLLCMQIVSHLNIMDLWKTGASTMLMVHDSLPADSAVSSSCLSSVMSQRESTVKAELYGMSSMDDDVWKRKWLRLGVA